jgi:tetratricopeptide (TPR) repeat protein
VVDKVENLIKQEKYSQALLIIDLILGQDEYNIEFNNLKANLHYKLQEHEEAIKIYGRLINLLPSSAETYVARGLAYHAIGDHNHSLADFNAAIELEPTNGYRFASRAFIKDAIGDLEGALEDYNKAIDLDPKDAISLNNRGLIEEKLGKMHLAKESFASTDKISGISQSGFKQITETNEDSQRPQKDSQLNFRSFVKTFKGLLSSASERKKFIKFLLKK